MNLKDQDLKQIDRDYLGGLAPDKRVEERLKLLEDLQEARDRLNQTAQNSSRPAGSFAPWEGGRAAEPVEAQLIAEIRQAELLHADETGWKEKGRLLWLWVLITPNVTLFLMGRRSWEVIAEVLEGFAGWPYVTG